jgi:cobalt-zinc-cadmium efflux system membrane fusion protein
MINKNKIIFAAVTAFVIVACSDKKKKETVGLVPDSNAVIISDSSLRLMDVQFIKPAEKLIESNIYLAGKVIAAPNNRASVSSDIEGKVERIFVTEGNFVKKGTPLMTLRSMALIELQNQYSEAKSQLDFLVLEYKRQEELMKNRIGALVDFQNTDSRYRAAASKVNALQAKLNALGFSKEFIDNPEIATQLTIYSPIDGYVFQLPVQLGVLATTDMTLAEIVNVQELMADVFVYDKDLDNVVEGQQVEIDFITHSYPSVIGTVAHISRAIDPQTKAVTVHVKFKAPAGKLVLPEMSIRCVVIKSESTQPKLAVPRAAVLDEDDHSYVYVYFEAEKNKVEKNLHKLRVLRGNQNEEWVHITFANPPAGEYQIVSKNVMIVENERKKRSGALSE